MKPIDIVHDAQLPVPAERADELIAQHGRRLVPQAPSGDAFFTGIDCSADGRTLIGFGDEFLLVWDAEQSAPRNRLRISGGITCAAISDSGATAIVGTAAGDLLMLRLPELDVFARCREEAAIHAVDVSDTDVGVYCDVKGLVRAFDFARNEYLPPIRYDGEAGRVWLTRDAELLVIDDEHTVLLCHPKQGWVENAFYYRYQEGKEEALTAGGWLVAKRNRQLHIWNRSNASQAVVIDHPTAVSAFDMTSTMSTIATITADQKMYLHSPRDPNPERCLATAQTYVKKPHSIKLRERTVFLGGRELTATQVTHGNLPVRTYFDRLIPIVSAHVSSDERWVTIGDQAGGVTIYDAREGHRSVDRIEFKEAGAVSVVDVDHETQLLIAGGHDGALRTVRLDGSTLERRIELGGKAVQAACLANGYAYAGNNEGVVAKVDLETEATIQTFAEHSASVRSVSVHGDKLITSDHDGVICVLDTASTSLLHRFQVDDSAYSVCLDEAGEHLYAGCRRGQLVCWNLNSGALVGETRLNRSTPRSFHVHGNTLVSLGLKGDLRLFDLIEQKQTLAIDIPGPGWQRFAYLNSSRTRVMTAGADGIMRFFCANTGIERGRGLHAATGFLWFGNTGDGAEPEWVWTDQSDSLDIVAQCGQDSKTLGRDSAERKAFFLERNSSRTMAQIGLYPDLATRDPSGEALGSPVLIRQLAGPSS